MTKSVAANWPLFFGLTMIMIGNGLQGSLLGIRATIEDFSPFTTGIIMSCFYLGYVIGSRFSPGFIKNVGHIRVFAAMASLASTTILLHAIFLDPKIWMAIRIVTGFAYAALYITIESWLNDAATNKTRGSIMAVYMILSYIGMVAGQFMLNIAAPEEVELFVLTSVLVSIALLPISLSKRPAPVIKIPKKVSIRKMYLTSPLGIIGMCAAGMIASIIFAIGPVYAQGAGYTVPQIAIFMSCFTIGGVLTQWPIGWLSDRYDRRQVITGIVGVLSLLCIGIYIGGFMAEAGMVAYVLTTLLGGAALSIYSLSISHTNDHLEKEEITEASASLVMVNGIGAAIGPLVVTALMGHIGVSAYFMSIAFIAMIVFLLGLWRVFTVPPIPEEARGHYTIMPIRAGMRVMNTVMKAQEEKPLTSTETPT